MVEKHFCLSRHSFDHHIDCALEPEEYNKLIKFKTALNSEFGMSDMEKSFLINNVYGEKYILGRSGFNKV